MTGKLVVDALSRPRPARGVDSPASRQRPRYLAQRAQPGDVVLVLGAGDVDRARPALSSRCRALGVAAVIELEQGVAARAAHDDRHRRPCPLVRAARARSTSSSEVLALGGGGRGRGRDDRARLERPRHDEGVDALVLKLAGELAEARVEGDVLVAGGGAANAVCLHRARAAGLGGFEFASAIPGTAGGGVRMNAGAYGATGGRR